MGSNSNNEPRIQRRETSFPRVKGWIRPKQNSPVAGTRAIYVVDMVTSPVNACSTTQANHPDVNKTSEPWEQSAQGKAWKQKGEDVLPFGKTLSGAEWICPLDKTKSYKRKKCECDVCSLHSPTCTHNVVPCEIILSDSALTTSMLIDSGALDGDYINEDIAGKLRAAGVKPTGAKKRVCSAFNDVCKITEGQYSLQI